MGGLFAGLGRLVGPWAARLWTATTWASVGWTVSDVRDFFSRDEESGGNTISYAAQKVAGATLVIGLLVGLLLTKMKRKR